MNPYRENQIEYKEVKVFSHIERKRCSHCVYHGDGYCYRCYGRRFIENYIYRREWKEEIKNE